MDSVTTKQGGPLQGTDTTTPPEKARPSLSQQLKACLAQLQSLGTQGVKPSSRATLIEISDTARQLQALSNQLVPRPFPYVPRHISTPAQKFLGSFVPFSLDAKTDEEWKKIRANMDGYSRTFNQQVQADHIEKIESKTIAGMNVVVVTPKGYDVKNDEKIAVFIHGGSFVWGRPKDYLLVYAPVAHKTGLKVYAPDYPLAPEAKFPKALNACVGVYKALLNTFKPQNIVFYGDSAGGGLIVSTLLGAHAQKLPMPAGVALMSPWCFLEGTGDSIHTLKGIAPVLDYDKNLGKAAKIYAGKYSLTNPLLSPGLADFSKIPFPRTLLVTGSRDLLESDTARISQKMRDSGIKVTLILQEAGWHGFQGGFVSCSEGDRNTGQVAQFLTASLKKAGSMHKKKL